jgi:hypothetical protein
MLGVHGVLATHLDDSFRQGLAETGFVSMAAMS